MDDQNIEINTHKTEFDEKMKTENIYSPSIEKTYWSFYRILLISLLIALKAKI